MIDLNYKDFLISRDYITVDSEWSEEECKKFFIELQEKMLDTLED
jgi:hypothetical protein